MRAETLIYRAGRPATWLQLVTYRLKMVGMRVVAGCLAILCAAIASLFNSVQPDPYMDEVFHVHQAQNYCLHNFTHWDSMITTLPGL